MWAVKVLSAVAVWWKAHLGKEIVLDSASHYPGPACTMIYTVYLRESSMAYACRALSRTFLWGGGGGGGSLYTHIWTKVLYNARNSRTYKKKEIRKAGEPGTSWHSHGATCLVHLTSFDVSHVPRCTGLSSCLLYLLGGGAWERGYTYPTLHNKTRWGAPSHTHRCTVHVRTSL